MKIEKEMERIRSAAVAAIETVAETFWATTLVPFCRRERLTFLVGNGDFFFMDSHGETVRVEVPKSLSDALNAPALGRYDLFGFYLRNVTKADLDQRTRTRR